MKNKVALTACMLAVLGLASTANAGTTRSGGGRGGNSFGGHSGSHNFSSHSSGSGHTNGVSLENNGSRSNTRGTVYYSGQTSVETGVVSHQGDIVIAGNSKSVHHEGVFTVSSNEAGSKNIYHEGYTTLSVHETQVMEHWGTLTKDVEEGYIYHQFSTTLYGDDGKVFNRSGATALKGEDGFFHTAYIGVSQNGTNINAHQGTTDIDNVNGSKYHEAYTWLATSAGDIVRYGNTFADDRGWIHTSHIGFNDGVDYHNNLIHEGTTSNQNGSFYHDGSFNIPIPLRSNMI